MHPFISINSIATIYKTKYSDFNDLYRYAREVSLYLANHELEQRSFSIKETTLTFLSHLDNPRYKLVVKEREGAILHFPTIPTIYIVPEITGTIDQLRPASRPTNQTTTDMTTNSARICAANDWEDYAAEEDVFAGSVEKSD